MYTKTIISTAVTTLLGTSMAYAAPSFEERDISNVGWQLTYLGKSYDADSNTSTFTYQMFVDADEKDLSHWVLGNDGEGNNPAFDSSCNDQGFGLDPTTGVSGLKCDDGQNKGTSQDYTVVVVGDACETEVDYAVKGGTYYAVAQTMGPGAVCDDVQDVTTYTLSGTAYVDANGYPGFDIDEPVLANVTVIIRNASGEIVGTLQTDANGYYELSGLLAGEYSVEIPALTEGVEDFNEQLGQYFIANEVYGLQVSLSADSADNNLGFAMNVAAVMNDLDTSDPDADGYTMAGTGKTIGFWKHQNSVAIKGKGRAQIDAETLQLHLDAVETGWLTGMGTFEFFSGNDYQDAFEIMKNTSSYEVDLLRKQLLGTELNHVSGRGLTGEGYNLQSVLINWAEYLAVYPANFSRDEILAAKDICDWINNSGE